MLRAVDWLQFCIILLWCTVPALAALSVLPNYLMMLFAAICGDMCRTELYIRVVP